MAKLSQIVSALSEVLGVPESTTENYVKPLRKAGLLSAGARGVYAPHQTSRDCAHLLLAIMGGSPTHAVEYVNDFISYQATNLSGVFDEGDDHLGFSGFVRNNALEEGHSIRDLISRIIDEYSCGSICRYGFEKIGNPINGSTEINISLIYTTPHEYFEVKGNVIDSVNSSRIRNELEPKETYLSGVYYYKDLIKSRFSDEGMRRDVTVYSKVFRLLGELCAKDGK